MSLSTVLYSEIKNKMSPGIRKTHALLGFRHCIIVVKQMATGLSKFYHPKILQMQ